MGGEGGGGWNHCPSVILSVCSIVSGRHLLKRSTILTKLGIVVYYNEAECPAEKFVYYLQCHGHSESLFKSKCNVLKMNTFKAAYLIISPGRNVYRRGVEEGRGNQR